MTQRYFRTNHTTSSGLHDWLMKAIFAIVFLMIALGIVSVVVNVGFGHDAAQSAAEEYAKTVPNIAGVNCNKYDTDANGYISCTLFRRNAEPLQIECGFAGCKIPPFVHD